MLPRQRTLWTFVVLVNFVLVFGGNPWPTENETSHANIELHTGGRGRFHAIFSCQGRKCSILLSRICVAANVTHLGLPSLAPRLGSARPSSVTAEATTTTSEPSTTELRTTTFAPQEADKRKGKKAFSKYFKKWLPKKAFQESFNMQDVLNDLGRRQETDDVLQGNVIDAHQENMIDQPPSEQVKAELLRAHKKMNQLYGAEEAGGYKNKHDYWRAKSMDKNMYRLKRQAKPAVPAIPAAKPAVPAVPAAGAKPGVPAPAAVPAKPGAPAAPVPAKPGAPAVPAAAPAKPGAPAAPAPAPGAKPGVPAAPTVKPGAPAAPAALPAKPGAPAVPAIPAKPGVPAAPAALPAKPGVPAAPALPAKPGLPAAAPALLPGVKPGLPAAPALAPKPGLLLPGAQPVTPPRLLPGALPALTARPLNLPPAATAPPAAPAWVPVFGVKPAGTPAPAGFVMTTGYMESEGPTEDLEAMFKAAEKESVEGGSTAAANPFNLDGLVGGFLGGLAGGIGPSTVEAGADAAAAGG